MDLLEELQSRVIPGDGAMGTLLMERGAPRHRCLEELCVSEPEMVSRVHDDYIAAGAHVIRTNSFGANAVRLEAHGVAGRVNEINWSAAQLAKQSARGNAVWVAGSVGPLGFSLGEASARGIDPAAVFQAQIGALLDGRVDLIFFETFTDLDELLLALHVKQALHHCPAICSLSCGADGLLPSGVHVETAFARLVGADAEIVGINCVTGFEAAAQILDNVSSEALMTAYPNAGEPTEAEGRLIYSATPESFARMAIKLAHRGARLIGGCCGTGPAHIAAMVELLGPGS